MASERALYTLSRSLKRLPSRTAAFSVQVDSTQQTRCASRLSSGVLQKDQYAQSLSISCHRQPKRHFTTTLAARKDDSSSSTSTTPPTIYTFSEIQSLADTPSPNRILIDVREPSELKSTGKIPGSYNLPITSAPDGFFLPAEEFEERFGWQKPGEKDEVIFYCKAGVRSRAAAKLAEQAGFGGKIGEFPGSWIEWEGSGGRIEREK
ncbi:uncharacterized protein Z518_07574 [Rhinocladiella mackenziei CBS 650.93]|uniref:Rhodanese domain-containing protein n=1 Tax=Rhinocladiella mackenziei CBS 650.93 TaxID=1442369 RepID=A0A0D2ILG4_9EURO|nr:uncharacterized protein Z518_07574 [Rhinocladiella mackenziei CBS 650.93]KIX04021.1 hypothetical protein Z518_07574 [Rhinocladiella mackenziei CBS 650.93]